MVKVKCYVADFNLRPGFPVISDLSVKGKSIESYIGEASDGADIDVSIDYSRRGKLPETIGPLGVGPDQLMEGLARLLAPVQTPGLPIVGLLLADAYAPAPTQFGVMFDIDGGDGDIGPRQGCAVFLTAISTVLNTDLTDPPSREFVSLIALHELGHAFNLWHVEGNSIMQPNPSANDLGSLAFEETQEHFLSLAGDSLTATSVLPGTGCSAYGLRPDGFPSGDSQPFASPVRRKTKLALRIKMSTDSLWPFEPVELDVSISIPKSDGQAVKVPNEIDPGYPAFQIWITRPDGMRFRYRPATRFCGRNGKLKILPGIPYRRDVAIGRQSGGYTFAVPGEYQIQAAFEIAQGDFLMSNTVKCEVKPPRPSSADWCATRLALDNGDARHFLQYKRRMPPLQIYESLQAFAGSSSSSPQTSAAIYFAVGRALAMNAAALNEHGKPLLERSRRHLEKALQLGCLSKKRSADVHTLLGKQRT